MNINPPPTAEGERKSSFLLAGKYSEQYEKDYPDAHPKTASFHGYLAGYEASKSTQEDIIVKLEQKLALFPKDPGIYERGLYDAYLNCLNWLKGKI